MLIAKLSESLLAQSSAERRELKMRLEQRRQQLRGQQSATHSAVKERFSKTVAKPSTLLATASLGFGLASIPSSSASRSPFSAVTFVKLGTALFSI